MMHDRLIEVIELVSTMNACEYPWELNVLTNGDEFAVMLGQHDLFCTVGTHLWDDADNPIDVKALIMDGLTKYQEGIGILIEENNSQND